MNDSEDPKLDIDDSLKEDQLLEEDEEEVEEDMEGDDDERKLNSSNTSLDKYVGKGRNSKYMTLLPEDFEPGDMDVLCGRGKRCFNSPVSITIHCYSRKDLESIVCCNARVHSLITLSFLVCLHKIYRATSAFESL